MESRQISHIYFLSPSDNTLDAKLTDAKAVRY